ncbi:MAG: VTT domain-containing protein, partial [Acutalibacteraceae bacterium]|nr:VTT domain-containing protein [Acutalibacteraceae bacterium]
PLYIYFGHHEIIEQFDSMEDVNAMLQEYKGYSILVYLVSQIIQIVICVIPGQMLQFAAGYTFGFWFGLVLSWVGAAIGAIISYYLAKLLGQGILYLIFDEKQMESFIEKLNSKKAIVAVFLIYLISTVKILRIV